MIYSYSMINQFLQCPHKFYRSRITKDIEFKQTEAMLWGIACHEAMEKYIKASEPIPNRVKHLEKWVKTLDDLRNTSAIEAEKELCFDENFEAKGWWDKDGFIRGKLDVFVPFKKDKAVILDWKTSAKGASSARYQKGEMEFFSWLVFLSDDDIEQIKTLLIWTETEDKPTEWLFKRNEDFSKIEDKWMSTIERIEIAVDTGIFNFNPTPLCGWCDVKDCKHNTKR